jgi:hypothetical protein
VLFRSHHPDEVTEKEVLKKLLENNIDVSQMMELSADHCQQAESSGAGESSA